MGAGAVPSAGSSDATPRIRKRDIGGAGSGRWSRMPPSRFPGSKRRPAASRMRIGARARPPAARDQSRPRQVSISPRRGFASKQRHDGQKPVRQAFCCCQRRPVPEAKAPGPAGSRLTYSKSAGELGERQQAESAPSPRRFRPRAATSSLGSGPRRRRRGVPGPPRKNRITTKASTPWRRPSSRCGSEQRRKPANSAASTGASPR